MGRARMGYFAELATEFGQAWNRFWYTPRDPIALAVLRVLVGVTACYFQATFAWDLIRLFGPNGMLPVEVVRQFSGSQAVAFSFLSYLRTPAELWTAQLLGTVVLVLFTIGLWTRVTSVLALVVTLSYIHRAPMLTGLFEPVLSMLLFYLCLGPSGRALSVDAWRAARRGSRALTAVAPATGPNDRSLSTNIAVRLIQIHLCVIYLMMGISKLAEPGETWWMGDAVWWLIAKPESRLIDLTWLARHPYVINAWSHLIVLIELTFPVLIWNRLARPLLLAAATLMWASLAPVTGLVPFCWTMAIAGIAFLPPDALRAVIARSPTEAGSEATGEADAAG